MKFPGGLVGVWYNVRFAPNGCSNVTQDPKCKLQELIAKQRFDISLGSNM